MITEPFRLMALLDYFIAEIKNLPQPKHIDLDNWDSNCNAFRRFVRGWHSIWWCSDWCWFT